MTIAALQQAIEATPDRVRTRNLGFRSYLLGRLNPSLFKRGLNRQ
jgi:hypothetical protein